MGLRSLSRLVSDSTMKSLLELAEQRGSKLTPLSSGRRLAVAAAQEAASQDGGVVDRHNCRGYPASRRGSGRHMRPFFDLWDPFTSRRTVKEMLGAVDRMIDAPFLRTPASSFSPNLRLPHDFIEDGDAYKLRIDMPGLSKEEVKVTVEDGQLVIKGEQKAEDKSDDGWSSHSYENYSTRLTLPENVQLEELKAELKNGVLRIVMPKTKEDPKMSAIPIEVH